VLSSGKDIFEMIQQNCTLHFDFNAFGEKIICFNEREKQSTETIYFDDYFKYFYRCRGRKIPFEKRYLRILDYLAISRNKAFYQLIQHWLQTNTMPLTAKNRMDDLLLEIGGE
jgi:hypothetical protein